ncbi:hypothetical protein [uncultured Methanobrevibacter sp.]|uniref:hypothetical protein n=1 Tax=uncultured Methanobrevibacter sp. TaxID=253161 RepID=UPI0025DD3C5C|nr:hypothetical protein [uncultured Methanobrevibacter sp.]
MANNNPLKPPKNTDLPFFAYGIFKPHQIAYSRIENHVRKYYEKEINYNMLIRDGVPLITPSNGKSHIKTKGFLIYFNEGSSKEAYKIISKTEYEKLYKWEEIKIGENKANVLMGANPKMGSSGMEGKSGDYDGQEDPYFKEAIEVVENELNDENKHWSSIHDFFKLQMSYLLLWTAIERYISLKYNCPEIWQNRKQLANEEVFKESLKKHVNEERKVYSAKDLREYTLRPENPEHAINYYYTIRCNVAHRGKALHSDEHMLRQSLKELFNIFKDVLDDTFDES